MKIEFVAIGNELLKGTTINTNASVISQALLENGYKISKQTTISDESIQPEMKQALLRADLVICTGGLGPTLDDHTKKELSKLFGMKLVFREELAKKMRGKFEGLSSIDEQATVPESATLLGNQIGTAPGFIFEKDQKICIALPGVPQDLISMLPDVVTWIEKKFPLKKKWRGNKLQYCLLPEEDFDPILRKYESSDLEIGIYPGLGVVRIEAGQFCHSEKELEQAIQSLEKDLEPFSDFRIEAENLEAALHRYFTEEKQTVSFAESCTGGALAARIVKMPGASQYFPGSFVTYSNEMKHSVLDVQKTTLDQKGAVSAEVVSEMLKGVLKNTKTDFAVAVSGIAGPDGGTDEKPVGTVFIGVIKGGEEPDIGRIQGHGSRLAIIEYTINVALSALYRRAVKNKKTFT